MKTLLIAICALLALPITGRAQGGAPPRHGPAGHAPTPAHGGPGYRGAPGYRGGPGGAAAQAGYRGAPGARAPAGFRGGPGSGVGRPRFAAGAVGRLSARDLAVWRGGYWWHGWRGGRLGWWWFVDGFWYWYAAPVYPYPLEAPDYYVAGETPPPAEPMWYYCYNPPGYYPWVRACGGPWRPVPAGPQPPPPPQ